MRNNYFSQRWTALALLWLLLGTAFSARAQVYYTLNDGSATTTLDQLRRVNADGTGDVLIKDNFVQTAGPLEVDLANNRVLVADTRVSQVSTSLTNTKIVAVSLAPGNAATTLITPTYIAGSTATTLAGLALDKVNNVVYYTLNDGGATTTLDQLRRVNADGTGDVLIKDNFVQTAGPLEVDLANNRVLVADTRVSQVSTSLTNTKIVAVSLAPGNAATTLITPTYIAGSTSTVVSDFSVDKANNVVYYTLNDGGATTTLDQLRRVNADGTGDVLIKDNFVQATGATVLDAASNRVLVADARVSQVSTSLTNTKIVAVSLAAGNAATTLVTPTYITGSTSTVVNGLALPEAVAPTVTTAAATTIGTTSAVLGGNVTADGGATVTGRGVVYSSTATTPTIGGSGVTQAANGSGVGTFLTTISSLTPGTTYYVRAYATNSAGTSYGSVVSFTTTPNAPVVTAPANGSLLNTTTPTYAGMALAGSTVTVYVDGTSIGTTTATGGSFSLAQPTALAQGSHTVYATAQASGSAVSANSTTNTFTIDTVRPSVAISSSTAANTGTSSAATFAYTVTFLEAVTGFVAGDVTVTNGTLSGFGGSATTYTFNVTPTANGAVTVNVPANVAQDAAGNGNTAAPQHSITYAQPVTAAPAVSAPAHVTLINTSTPTYSGTAVAGSTVTVFVDGTSIGTTIANASGNWSLSQPTALSNGTHTVNATAQSSGSAVSPVSNTNGFTVDTVAPVVTIASSTAATGGSSSSSPFSYTVSFSESVGSSFIAADVTVGNGTLSNFQTASSFSYTFNVTPTANGAVTVSVAANQAQDLAGNGNTASSTYSITYTAPTATVVSVTRSTPSPTATATVSYQVTFSAAVTGVSTSNFSLTTTGAVAGASVTSVAGSGTTYTVTVNTGTGDGTLRLDVANNTGLSPAVTNTPYTLGQVYTITKSFAASPTLSIQGAGSPSGGSDVTAFVDVVQVLSGGSPVANALLNPSFETHDALANGNYGYNPTGASWTFNPSSGIAENGSPFGPATPPSGIAVAFLQNGASAIAQNLAVPTGNYQVQFQANQRACCNTNASTYDQILNVYLNGVFIGTIQPGTSSYSTFTSAAFSVTAPALVATISSPAGTSGSSTSTAPIQYSVTFSQSVGTSFTASDLTVTNGTVSGFAGSGSGPYTFNVTPTANGAVTVSVAANQAQDGNNTGNDASSTYTLTYTAPATFTSWTGAVSTDWFTAGNWSNGVPTATLDAIIPAAAPRMPSITAGTATTKALTLDAGATLTQTGGTLDVRADLTNNGTFQPTGGTVALGATTLASVLGSSNTRFWNLTIGASGAGSGTSASTTVQRLFTLNGPFTTNGNPLTLESNATNTALVVNTSTANAIVGNVTVQRYIAPDLNPGPGYRHYSSPVSNATVGSLATASFTPVVNPTYNTSATPTAETPFPTVYFYDQARLATATNNLAPFNKGWTSPNALSDPLTVGKGYTVNLAASQTLSVTGPQNNGTVNMTLNRNATGSANAVEAGWQLVGNPYPSPLDYSLVAPADRINLEGAIYVFESTSQYNGSYRAYVNGVWGNPILAQGQGFFARVSNGQTSGTLTLRNSQRLTAYTNPVFHRTAETRPLVQLDLQGAGKADPVYVYFENGATTGIDREFDAVKLPNSTGLNVSAESGTERLAINGLPALGTATVTVPLTVGVPVAGSYAFNAAQLLNLSTTPVYLRDKQTGAVVDLRTQPSYSFMVSNASALVTGRFELVFSPQAVLATAPAALAAQVGVYPNPATTTAFVELPAALGRVAVAAELMDALGRPVLRLVLPAQGAAAHRLALGTLATGVYTLHLATSAGVLVKKLVVE
ncbi:Ig-like domain-containing protein [Hymenobacter antarcticus]|uniref:Fibronectin type-III domain-containing protein n=1 Tax=Hymenobacter antarcticus TaxID=486270 RepID=A0ABP7PKV9_9BACT